VAGDIVSRVFLHSSIRPVQTLLARYLEYLLTEIDQTCTTIGVCGNDERVKFWGQKVKGQGHDGIKYAAKCTFWPHHMLAEA